MAQQTLDQVPGSVHRAMTAAVRELTILFADIGGSTALYEQVGDVEAHRLVAESLALMRECIESNNGVLLRTVGDAALASFEQADHALAAACDMQLGHLSRQLSVRIGFHVGQVIPDGGDVYGHAVNLAARIASFARVDEITATAECVSCLSDEARQQASYLDRVSLKGTREPVEIWRIDWMPEDGPQTAIAVDPRSASVTPASDLSVELRVGQQRYRLKSAQGPFVLGRSTECDVSIESDEASRRHAVIEFSHGQCLLTDTSTNGTWLCRPQVQPVLIRRDTVVLDGRGQLGLGTLPGTSGAVPLGFRVGNQGLTASQAAAEPDGAPTAKHRSAP